MCCQTGELLNPRPPLPVARSNCALLSDSTESLPQWGGELVERPELPPGCGAVWGGEGRPKRCAVHGAEARSLLESATEKPGEE